MNIYVFGAGALGSNLMTNIVVDIQLKNVVFFTIDYDTVEARNIQAGTQFYFREQIGKQKVDALRMNVYTFFNKKITAINKKIAQSNISEFSTDDSLFIDAFDNASSRNLLYTYCKQNKINCIHIGFSPQFTFEVTWNDAYSVQDNSNLKIDICELSGARSFIKTVCGMASQVILQYVNKSEKINLIGNKYISSKA